MSKDLSTTAEGNPAVTSEGDGACAPSTFCKLAGHAGGDGGQRSPPLVRSPVRGGAAAEDEDLEAASSRSGGDKSQRTEPWPERPRPRAPMLPGRGEGRGRTGNRRDSDFSPRRGPLPWLFF